MWVHRVRLQALQQSAFIYFFSIALQKLKIANQGIDNSVSFLV